MLGKFPKHLKRVLYWDLYLRHLLQSCIPKSVNLIEIILAIVI